LCLLFLPSALCFLSSAEHSEVPARRETIYIQFKPNLNIEKMSVN